MSTRTLLAGVAFAATLIGSAATAEAQCPVSGPSRICPDSTITLTATLGDNFRWELPGGFFRSGQTLVVSMPGAYSLQVYDIESATWSDPCAFVITLAPSESCGVIAPPPPPPPPSPGIDTTACPRNARFWSRGCQRERSPIGRAALRALVARVDARSAVFSWPDSNALWCGTLREREHADARQLALRQYAAVLANLEAAAMHLSDRGLAVGIGADTRVRTPGGDVAVAAWAASTDQELLGLQGASLRDRTVKQAYRRIEDGARAICRGRGMASTCPRTREDDKDDEDDARAMAMAMDEGAGGPGSLEASVTPNPFRTSTRFSISIADGAGAEVELGVYDVSGRRVALLASGHFAAGAHAFEWDGRASDGRAVRSGVYFMHGRVGGEIVRRSVLRVE